MTVFVLSRCVEESASGDIRAALQAAKFTWINRDDEETEGETSDSEQ